MERLKHIAYGLLLFFAGCTPETRNDCFQGHGEQKEELRTVDDFQKLVIFGDYTCQIVPDSVNFVEIFGGENFIGQIKTEVADNTLSISENITCKFVRDRNTPYKVTVHARQINEIDHYGSDSLYCQDTLYAQTFTLNKWDGGGDIELLLRSESAFIKSNAGSGDITISGASEEAYFFQRGFNFNYFESFQTGDLTVDKGGTGDMHLSSSEPAQISFNSEGFIYTYHSPEPIVIEESGNGSIIEKH